MRRPLLAVGLALLCAGCAAQRPMSGVRVAILEVKTAGGVTVTRNGQEEPAADMPGIMATLEGALIQENLRVVPNPGPPAPAAPVAFVGLVNRLQPRPDSGPAVYGIAVNVRENVGILTALTLGLMPITIDTTATVTDLRTGETVAAADCRSLGSIYSSRGIYRGVRGVARLLARDLRRLESRPAGPFKAEES